MATETKNQIEEIQRAIRHLVEAGDREKQVAESVRQAVTTKEIPSRIKRSIVAMSGTCRYSVEKLGKLTADLAAHEKALTKAAQAASAEKPADPKGPTPIASPAGTQAVKSPARDAAPAHPALPSQKSK